jgi:serine/threonine protein kinase
MQWYIITEYVPGGDLTQIFKNKDLDFPWNIRTKTALDVAAASTLDHLVQTLFSTITVSYLHSKDVIFRDLKSENILVSSISKIH